MSEWDYLPTPYENLIEQETKNSLLTFISFCCLVEGKIISPSDLFIKCDGDEIYNEVFCDIIKRTSMKEVLRTMLQYEDIRSHKKRDKVLEIVKKYVERHGEKDL